MDLREYTEKTGETAVYPEELPEFVTTELVYVTLGLAEAGESQEKLKKAIREDDPEYLEDMVQEIGDGLWYMARISHELSEIDEVEFDGTLNEVAEDNIDKLLDRQERGKLTGEGDNR